MFRRNPDPNNVAKAISAAYCILVLHVLLVAVIGFMVIFVGGLIQNMGWVLLAMCAIASTSGYMVYRRIKQQGRQLKEILTLPEFTDRNVEINFMGGLASLKIGRSEPAVNLMRVGGKTRRIEEDPEAGKIRELSELVRLLENNLITWDEYSLAKKKILDP